MTSMRIDGDKSAKVWARRLKNLVESAEADGVAFQAIGAESPWDTASVRVYKDGVAVSINLQPWSNG